MSGIRRAGKRPRIAPELPSPARKSDRTRARILDGATALLWTSPYRELTVSKLMAHVGVSRPAFYQYFPDLHDLMEELLRRMGADLVDAAKPWFTEEGEPLETLRGSITALVRLTYDRGPFIRAVADASASDGRLERTWSAFLARFDDAVTARIEEQQSLGWVAAFDARPVAVALNRLNVATFIHAFGRRPRKDPEAVRRALTRIWASTLYPGAA